MTSLDQNFSDLANILMQRRQMQRQAKLDDMARQREEQAMTLQSLHINQLRDEQAYREGLRGAMANPGSTSVTNVVPRPESAPSLQNLGVPGGQYMPPPDMEAAGADHGNVRNLRELGLMNPAPTTPYEPTTQQASPIVQAYNEGRVQTTTTPKSVSQAGADYAMKMGRPEEAAKYINMDDALAQYGAKVQAAGGDLSSYYRHKQSMDNYNAFVKEVAPLLKSPAGRALAQTTAAKYQKMFPSDAKDYDISDMSAEGDDVVKNVKDPQSGQVIGRMITMPDGTTHFEKAAAAEGAHNVQEIPSPDGKTSQKFQYNPQTQRYDIPVGPKYAVKSQVPNVNIHTGDDKPPKGYRWKDNGTLEPIPGGPGDKSAGGGKVLPASQLESIADMKRVKDVLAEADSDMQTSKVSTGPVAGRLQSLGSKVGLADDSFVNVQQKLQTAQNIMLKLRSGAAVTESEYNRFLKEYPTPNDPPEVFKRKMQNTISYATTLMDEKMGIYEEGGYRVPQSVKSGNQGSKTAPQRQGKAPRTAADYLSKWGK